MKLLVNGMSMDVHSNTLEALLDAQGLRDAKVATAVNGAFVPATFRVTYLLSDGDSVEILAPMQGG
ncbi:sulfur carrier protein ThiS [Sulfitobacter sp.]|jgi:sulfur carrier protein|uniref:sulfur carrier protein ThiS n=1 Tax=Sulfitobacter sp. TaxID=1903071 RepID=UPI000C0EF635|nr:thiamine biosynthesis protein ThiS [Roseobacter sp.]MBV50305.1 thiamine biosynthesis protein ThiS [Roseobacter sp.]PHR06910.1 MAG: thiamine biosynthesis protein ThiS [Sulfitobacter sp.]THF91738.1 MAG: sulfur carrier protein ThiS [Sulfitobacter sp. SK025]|tara:strand:+ start:785 stop:982 length:198 start_codon:yes stop_codon:yes gene_type:complete